MDVWSLKFVSQEPSCVQTKLQQQFCEMYVDVNTSVLLNIKQDLRCPEVPHLSLQTR